MSGTVRRKAPPYKRPKEPRPQLRRRPTHHNDSDHVQSLLHLAHMDEEELLYDVSARNIESVGAPCQST
jgi:hypothetical protein